jgi:hypothetical protein
MRVGPHQGDLSPVSRLRGGETGADIYPSYLCLLNRAFELIGGPA